MREIRKLARFVCLALVLLAGMARDAWGQEQRDSFPGVRLGLLYESSFQPVLAIKPFTNRFGGAGVDVQAEAIIARDLR
jgi:hypothetical protein